MHGWGGDDVDVDGTSTRRLPWALLVFGRSWHCREGRTRYFRGISWASVALHRLHELP